ncbi:hypothetical protein GCM10010399_55020 [Dactylosporangium fulvum]
MKREQLEHVLRAASAIAGDPDMLVIGSQSILGAIPEHLLAGAGEADESSTGVCFEALSARRITTTEKLQRLPRSSAASCNASRSTTVTVR